MNTTKQTILTNGNSQTKLAKGNAQGFQSFGIHLAPSDACGAGNTCPWASKGCRAACLNTAGRGGFSNVQAARIRKTQAFFTDPMGFVDRLKDEIERAIKSADRKGLTPVFRLNLTSDIAWEEYGVPQSFPDVQFYDYTKGYLRMLASGLKAWPANYHLTYSRSETTADSVVRALCKDRKRTVAAVFRKRLPKQWLGLRVIDGDKDDLRFLDPAGVIVGLVDKGKAKSDATGFVIE